LKPAASGLLAKAFESSESKEAFNVFVLVA
jgi:hypothetical protein